MAVHLCLSQTPKTGFLHTSLYTQFTCNMVLDIQLNLHKRDTFWKVKTVCYTQVSVLSRFSQKFCHEEIVHSVRFMIKLQYKEDQTVCLTLFYMIQFFIDKKITHESQVCTYLDSIINLSVNWSINSLFVDFWHKTDFGQV